MCVCIEKIIFLSLEMVLSAVIHAQTSVHMHVLMILQNERLQGIARLPPPPFFKGNWNAHANSLRHKCIGVLDAWP